MELIRKNDVEEWLHSQVTKAYFAGIKDQIQKLKDDLSFGITLTNNCEQHTARLVGRIEALTGVLDIDLDDIIIEEEIE